MRTTNKRDIPKTLFALTILYNNAVTDVINQLLTSLDFSVFSSAAAIFAVASLRVRCAAI